MIHGLHHVSLKCRERAVYEKARDFYCRVLGMRVYREWETGMLVDTGAGYVEIFCNGEGETRQGAVRHLALACDNVDETAEAVRAAGYEIFVEPKDVVLPSDPPVRARVAFCRGALSEEIEFFDEKKG